MVSVTGMDKTISDGDMVFVTIVVGKTVFGSDVMSVTARYSRVFDDVEERMSSVGISVSDSITDLCIKVSDDDMLSANAIVSTVSDSDMT